MSSRQDVNTWFKVEVERWRKGSAVTWSMMLLFPCVYFFSFLALIDIWHPISWLTSSVFVVFSLSKWLYVGFMALIIMVVGLVNAKHFTVKPIILCSRASKIISILQPQRLMLTGSHCLAAVLLTWCFLGIIGGKYQGLSKPSEEQRGKFFLNEHHIFIILHCVYVGWLYSVQFFVCQKNCLAFPVVQQAKFFQVKSEMFPLLMSSAAYILRKVKYFYVLYYLLIAQVIKRWTLKNVSISGNESDGLNTLRGLVDLSLLYYVCLTGTLVHILFRISALLYKVYQTEHCVFPVDTAIENYKNKCLPNALSCSINPLLQYLGYLDLYLMSKQSPHRRRDVFTLTQLGGHAHNWNNIVSSCLGTLQELTNEVVCHNSMALASGPSRQWSGDKPIPASVKDPNLHSKPPTPVMTKIYERLKRVKALAYFLADLPDTPSRKLFADARKHVWAVEGLSSLVAASYAEDMYGVVQKSLPEIISTILNLQEAVEKHFKLSSTVIRKSHRDQPYDAALPFALKAALKSSLYRIVTTFDHHLDSVPLSFEHKRRLQLFKEYRE